MRGVLQREGMCGMSSIAKKMAAAAKRIGYGVQKDGRNDFHRYDYTSAGAVRMACGRAMGEEGIAVSSSIMVLCSEQRLSEKGKNQNHVEVLVTLTFVCSDTGETLTTQGLGCGSDVSDKAPMKAVTAAEKYAYVSAFTLAMGEEPEQATEHDGHQEAAQRRGGKSEPTPQQAESVAALRAECGLLMREVRSAEDLHAWFKGAYPLLSKVPSDVAMTARTMISRRAAALGVDDDTIGGWADAIRKAGA